MDFLIINKKSGFQDTLIDYNYLSSVEAPTINSFSVIKQRYRHFDVFVYPHYERGEDKENRDFALDAKESLFVNGFAHFDDGNLRNANIRDFFVEVEKQREIEGDYQIGKITANGDGYINGSDIGWRQLYRYESSQCEVFATSVKLIVDSVRDIHKYSFGENFDSVFIQDSLFRGWFRRRHSRRTVFRKIEKLFPHDRISFSSGKTSIERRDEIAIPHTYQDQFKKDPQQFYSSVFSKCQKFVQNVWSFDFYSAQPVKLGLTGGLDSRATLAILSPLAKAGKINLCVTTSGHPDHPDVAIAKKVASALCVKHLTPGEAVTAAVPTNGSDYRFNFYLSEGFWGTTNFIRQRSLEPPTRGTAKPDILLLGADTYKRTSVRKMLGNNFWFAARTVNANPFAFPVLGIKTIGYLGLLDTNTPPGTSFVYYLLQQYARDLLDIPFAGQYLPRHYVKPYSTVQNSKSHKSNPIYWDRRLVKQHLSIILKQAIKSEFANLAPTPSYNEMLGSILSARLPTTFVEKWNHMRKHAPRSLFNAENRLLEFAVSQQLRHVPHRQQKSILMDLACVSKLHTFSELLK